MVTHTQRVVRGPVSSEHIVQLFDAPESLGVAVAAFLHEGVLEGAPLLVAAKGAHVAAITAALVRRGLSMPALIRDRQLTLLDADTALRSFMRHGKPDAGLFDAQIGDLVCRLSAESEGRLRIYGEMVEILAEEANFPAAEALEDLWNQLGSIASFRLLCGYSSAHFAGPDAGAALRHICDRHTRVHQNSVDLLGNWLLDARGLPA